MSSHYQVRIATVSLSLALVVMAARGQGEADSAFPTVELQAKHILKFEARPTSFSFSRDGKRFASNDGRSARVWDTRTWEQVGSFTDDEQLVHCAILSPDGRTLAFTRDVGKEIHLLDVASGKVLRTLSGHGESVFPTFSPDGKTIASTTNKGDLKLWDVETGKELGRFTTKLKGATARCLCFSQDSSTLAAATEDGAVHLLDVQQGKEVRQLPPANPALNSPEGLAFSPDGRFLAVGPRFRNSIAVWDVRSCKRTWQLQWPAARDPRRIGRDESTEPDPNGPLGGIYTLAFAADGRSLIVVCNDDRIRVWEMSTGRVRYQVVEPVAHLLAVAPAAPLFATASGKEESCQVSVWDSRTWILPQHPPAPLDLEKAWSDLDTSDAALAYRRMRDLASSPKAAVAVLDKCLPTADPMKPSAIEALVRELDDDGFEARDRARRRLAELGDLARPALSEALAGNPSSEARKRIQELLDALDAPLAGDRLRLVRAVEVLESIGSLDARRALKRLAGGDPGSLLTRQARAALERLDAN
jgi:WD40 repeat protein